MQSTNDSENSLCWQDLVPRWTDGVCHENVLGFCCAGTIIDTVMCLRGDHTPLAMGEIETASARPSDDLFDPAKSSNLVPTYVHDMQPGVVTPGRGAKRLPKSLNSNACKQVWALYTAMQVRAVL